MNSTKIKACPRIYTRCPSCHNDTLTVNKGHLLCTWHACPNPTLIDKILDEWRRFCQYDQSVTAQAKELWKKAIQI
jgi:hypothetical protein